MKLVWSARADDDLERIWRYIEPDSPRAADALLRRLQAKCDALKQFPELGQLHRGKRKDVRRLVEGEYLIFYRVQKQHVQILRVMHGRRNLANW